LLALTILGNNSAVPAFGRNPTAQILQTQDDSFLIDCGEGTQMQIAKYKLRRSKLSHIFISHLHGDHYFGLIGLLNSFALLGRIQPLHVYGPERLKEVIDLQFSISNTVLPFNFTFHPISQTGLLLDAKHYTVECFPTKHRIECWGFIVREKRNQRKLNIEKVTAHHIPPAFFTKLQHGEDYISPSGEIIKNELLTEENVKAKSYAFCADTIYDESLAEIIKGVDLAYHESTYLSAMGEKATERFHSTTTQAATIALKAKVHKLIIGHFSAKFESLEQFETEAREVFPNTENASEGMTYLI